MGSGQSTRKKSLQSTCSENPDSDVNFEDFQILRAIGKGSFGKVCIVQKKDTKKLYAMKYMSKSKCVERDAFSNVLKEIEILSSLEHPFLVNLWFTFQDEEDMFMVVDLLLGGDIRYHLQQGIPFEEPRVSLYLCEIALALDYLRRKRILHRDIKPDNILLDEMGHAHITDFNIATHLDEGTLATSMSGTKPYMAPEVIDGALDLNSGYSYPADWWSLGICAYEMLCIERPYDIHSNTPLEDVRQFFQSTCLRLPRHLDKHMVDLIQQLLCINPDKRLCCVEQMKQHPHYASVNFDAVLDCKVTPPFVPSKDQLNCDPTFELEEMIIEAKPLHKKKKRLSKQSSRKDHTTGSVSGEEPDPIQLCMDSIQEQFIIYNRERELRRKEMEKREQEWEEELQKVIS